MSTTALQAVSALERHLAWYQRRATVLENCLKTLIAEADDSKTMGRHVDQVQVEYMRANPVGYKT